MSKNIIIGGVTHQNVDRLLVQDADSNNLVPFYDQNADAIIDKTATSFSTGASAIRGSIFSGNTVLQSISAYNAGIIDSSAFSGCIALNSVNFPNLETVGFQCFMNCRSLTKVVFPRLTTLQTSGTTATFGNCNSLKNVVLPKATYFPSNCFGGDLELLSVYTEKMGSISAGVFSNCSSIEALVILKDSVCTLSAAQSAFEISGFYIYVPRALVDTYKVATNWINYADHFRAAEDYPTIVEQCRLGTYGDEEEE